MKLYCGFKLSEDLESLVQRVIRESCSDLAPLVPTPLDRLHVTTAFLGEMDVEKGKDILRTTRRIQSFDVYVDAVGSWPGVLFFSIGSQGANAVHRSQGEAYAKVMGRHLYPAVYSPHLTLAKAERGEPLLKARAIERGMFRLAGIRPGHCMVNSLGLYCKSELLETITLRES